MRLLLSLLFFVFIPYLAFASEESGVEPHMIWRIIDFIIFVAILYYFFKEPIVSFFKNRKKQIQDNFEEAEKLKVEAERLLKETEEKLSKLDEEIDKIVKTFKSMAENERKSILKESEDILERIRESVETEKISLINKAKLELLRRLSKESINSLKEKLSGLTVDEHITINKKFIGSINP